MSPALPYRRVHAFPHGRQERPPGHHVHQVHAEVRAETYSAFLRLKEFRKRVAGSDSLDVELGTHQRVPQGGVYLPAQRAARHERVHGGAVLAQNLAVF